MKNVYIFLVLLASTFAQAQEDMILQKAISLGLENNFQIRIDEQNILIAENNDSWARAGRTPTVDLTGSFNNTLTVDNNPARFINGTFNSASLGASLNGNYVVYSGGRIKISKALLELTTTQEKLNKQLNINSLIRDIYQQYYDVLLQIERLEVLSYNYSLSKDKLALEQTKREYGASNMFNIIQFENGLITDSINLVNQKRQIDISQRRLYNTLNINGSSEYNFPERLSVVPEEIEREALLSALDEENYTIKSLELLASLNKLNTQLARSAKKPNVSLNASIGGSENAFKFFANDPNTGDQYPLVFSNQFSGSIGAQASWNLYDGGVRNSDIQNAKINEEINQISLAEARLSIANQLDILIGNYENQRVLLNLADEQIKLAQRNLNITEERFKSAQVTSIDFRNIQTQYLNAAFNKVNAIYSLILSKSEIDHLVGLYGE